MAERRMPQTGQTPVKFVIDRREQILDAAQDIVQRDGYTGFGYRELSLAVGIRKASIHYHFPKKEDLVLALVQRYTDNFVRSLEAIEAGFRLPAEQLDAYFSLFEVTLAQSNNEKCCLAGVMGAEIGALPEFVRVEILDFCARNQIWLASLVDRGIAQKTFNPALISKTVAQLIFSALEGAMMLSRLHNSSQYLLGVIEQLRSLIFSRGKSDIQTAETINN